MLDSELRCFDWGNCHSCGYLGQSSHHINTQFTFSNTSLDHSHSRSLPDTFAIVIDYSQFCSKRWHDRRGVSSKWVCCFLNFSGQLELHSTALDTREPMADHAAGVGKPTRKLHLQTINRSLIHIPIFAHDHHQHELNCYAATRCISFHYFHLFLLVHFLKLYLPHC